MSLFQEQTIPLQFVGEKSELPEEGHRSIIVSILHLTRARLIELSSKTGGRDVDSTCHLDGTVGLF